MNLSSISVETIKLKYQTNYKLSETSKIKEYFNTEIQYQQSLTNKLSKCLTCFDYTNKILTVFLTVFSSTNIFTHAKNEQVTGLITAIFSLVSSLLFGVVIKLKEEIKIKKKKHNRLLYLCRNKLDCTQMLIANSIKDVVIDHDEFLEVIGGKKVYDCK